MFFINFFLFGMYLNCCYQANKELILKEIFLYQIIYMVQQSNVLFITLIMKIKNLFE
jgi:hypothetical protein